MPEEQSARSLLSAFEYWRGHYGPDGAKKIEGRRRVYDLVSPDERFDPDLEFFDVLHKAGFPEDTSFLDIGSGRPFTLQLGRVFGFNGTMVALDPNTEQLSSIEESGSLVSASDSRKFSHSAPDDIQKYAQAILTGKIGRELIGITALKAIANNQPFKNRAFKVASFMYSLGSIEKNLQEPAIIEASRVIDRDGVLAVGAPGFSNKAGIHQNEIHTTIELSTGSSTEYQPPQPPNSGGTAEDAYVLLTKHFENVYAYENEANIVIKSESDFEILLNAMRSLRDRYLDENLQFPTEVEFERSLQKVMRPYLLALRTSHRPIIVDHSHRVQIFASNAKLPMPARYELITREKAQRIYSERVTGTAA